MFKITMLSIILLSLFISSNEYAYANEQTCISSDGTPNHKIGNFPTRGNPHKFKKQKIKFCFPKRPIKTNKNKYIASVVGVTLTGIPIKLDLEMLIGTIKTLQESIGRIRLLV